MTEDNELSFLKSENRRLRRALEELSILNDIAVAINSALSLDRILEIIVQKSTKHLNVEQVAVMLLDEKSDIKPFQTMVRGWDSGSQVLPYRLDTQLTGWMLKHRSALLINDFKNDDRFHKSGEESDFVNSLLCVPLTSKNRMIGLIAMFNKKDESGFTLEDQRLLSIIGSQSSQVIENARLLKEEQELQTIQHELRLAYDIQTNLLPKEPPSIAGYEIFGHSIPAREVGGDYYDFITIDQNRIAFCLGDISGKGMPAALLMSNLQATVRAQTQMKTTAAKCLERTNSVLFHNTPSEKFSTFFYGILDLKQHLLCYANAGHNFPILFKKNQPPRQLNDADIVLGVFPTFPYRENSLSLDQGDILVLFSDGITEAIDKDDKEFGEDRLISVISAHADASAQTLTGHIIDAVKHFAGDFPQWDDMTLIIIKRL